MSGFVLIAKAWVTADEASTAFGVSRETLELFSSKQHHEDFRGKRSAIPPIICDKKGRSHTYCVGSLQKFKSHNS